MEIFAYVAYILLAVLILLLMVTIHEFGHYISGKLLKFKINEFSIGFGPKLFSRKNKKTGEVFSLRIVPLGGFCAFEGEDGVEDEAAKSNNADNDVFKEERQQSASVNTPKSQLQTAQTLQTEQNQNHELKKFTEQPPWKRIIVLACGGLFNLVSAVLFTFIFSLAVGLEKPHQTIDFVFKDANGVACNDLLKGDKVVKVDGKELTYMYALSDAVANCSDTAVFVVERIVDGQIKTLSITLEKKKLIAQKDDYGNEYKESTGFGFIRSVERDQSFLTAITYSVPYMGKMSWSVLNALGKLITGKVPLNQITGPVGTITTIAEYSILDWRYILLLLPLLAANLGIFNLLPIPALDGSKIIFCIIEWIRKKPVNRKVESMIHAVGIVLLFGFVIFVDIFGLFARCGL